ncbi:glutathione S-transferase [Paraburkholderia strydomiana]|uniref:glutathione S-transferase family protein n=1 Tax=Paraburkholderia strydomiana TaxID=1245417 RepID=UPI0038BBEB39
MSIVVHHLENSRSQRVLWLLEELDIPYQVERYQREPSSGLAPDSLRRIHPLGKSPVIQDGEVTIAETGAIVDYLVNQAGGKLGQPAEAVGAMRYTHFMHYAEGSLMPPLYALLVLARMGESGRSMATSQRTMFATHLTWLDNELSDRPWFAGPDFTAADVMMSFPLEAARQRGGLDASYERLTEYLRRAHGRPAYQRGLDRGGPYAFA